MNAPLLRTVTKVLTDQEMAVLGFNFRGVGTSTGAWGGGEKELADVAAAVAAARAGYPEVPLGLAGWSFGAVIALRWTALAKEAVPYAGIAPPVRSDLSPGLPGPTELPKARRRLILGDRDQFTTVAELQEYADSIDAELVVVRGSDHFFYHRERRIGELVAEVFS
jgi:alpha/beta superfamily hydrolase